MHASSSSRHLHDTSGTNFNVGPQRPLNPIVKSPGDQSETISWRRPRRACQEGLQPAAREDERGGATKAPPRAGACPWLRQQRAEKAKFQQAEKQEDRLIQKQGKALRILLSSRRLHGGVTPLPASIVSLVLNAQTCMRLSLEVDHYYLNGIAAFSHALAQTFDLFVSKPRYN